MNKIEAVTLAFVCFSVGYFIAPLKTHNPAIIKTIKASCPTPTKLISSCPPPDIYSGSLPSAYENTTFEGVYLPKSTYKPGTVKPTNYKAPRVVHHMLRHLQVSLQDARIEQIAHVPNAVVIEVGAYDGHWTREIASKANVKRVYSFEATPSKVPKIKAAYEPCCKDKVVFIQAAVTNYSGTAKLYVPRGPDGDSKGFGQDSLGNQKFHLGNEQSIEVPAVRLDEVVKEHVDMLVSDTQGNEFNVLKGAEKLIDKYGIDILQFEWQPKLGIAAHANYGDMLHWLWDKGYTCFDGKRGIWDTIPEGVGIDRSLSHFTYLMDVHGNGPSAQGGWTDLICFKFR